MAAVVMSEQVLAARMELKAARELLVEAKQQGTGVTEAEKLVLAAMKAYRQLVPVETEQAVTNGQGEQDRAAVRARLEVLRSEEASKKPEDPTRLSGTEIRRKAKQQETAAKPESPEAQSKAVREERAAAPVAEYLEPEMQRLLADQVLRGESLKWTRQLIQWLSVASGHCAAQQPAFADKWIRQTIQELQIQERALKEADVVQKPAKRAKGAK
jgi:hypothetical protein